jgi:hypothetical protein
MYRTAAVFVTCTLFASSTSLLAQRGYGRGQAPAHNYNPATEITFTGVVDRLKPTPAPGHGAGGLHLLVRAKTGVMEVLLGPAWYLSSKDFEFARGDNITVTGSKLTMDGQEVVVAREVKKADKVLTLRDANGLPLWSGLARGSKSQS